jgi:phage shock protein A
MGIFNKITDIINSNLNHILDKAQDPIKMDNLMVNEMEDTLVELKSNMARVMAEQKTLNRSIKQTSKDIEFYSSKAKLAVTEGKDDLARRVIEQSLSEEKKLEHLINNDKELSLELNSYKDDLNQLERKIREGRERLDGLKSRARAAESKLKVGNQLEKAHKQIDLERLEALENQIDRIEAEGEVNQLAQRSLKQELAELEQNKEVEERLSKLKNK